MTAIIPPVFEQPWHAQVFAITVHLSETGLFDWSEWTQTFGAVLAHHGHDRDLNGGDDYFAAWIEALEKLIVSKGVGQAAAIDAFKEQWEHAYLTTPHGHPVHLRR